MLAKDIHTLVKHLEASFVRLGLGDRRAKDFANAASAHIEFGRARYAPHMVFTIDSPAPSFTPAVNSERVRFTSGVAIIVDLHQVLRNLFAETYT